MKRLVLWSQLLMAVMAIAGMLIWQYPQMVREAGTGVQSARQWVDTRLNPSPTPHTSRPSPTVSPLSMKTPNPVQVPPPPIALALSTAAPAPLPVSTSAWTGADCKRMAYDMAWDAQLDSATAASYASSDPAKSAIYSTAAEHWTTILAYMKAGPCIPLSSGGYTTKPLSGTQCTDPPAWAEYAITGHVADEKVNPQNTAWDNEWIAIYTTLANDWATSPGC